MRPSSSPPAAPFSDRYLAWLATRPQVAKLEVGSDRQIAAPNQGFSLRGLAATGEVWTGKGRETRHLFLDHPDKTPTENICSIALLLTYGRFRYFTGGDLSVDTEDGRYPWMDVETPIAQAAGRVEVAVADHHAYYDACGPGFVRALDTQAYVIPSWHVTHPGQAQLQRLLGSGSGAARPDVFATEMLPENRLINARFAGQLPSAQGHVVVRVAPGGDSLSIFVLDAGNERDEVTLVSGPYRCRAL